MSKIPRSPLPTCVSSDTNDHRLRQIDAGTMVLEPRYDTRAILGGGLIFFGLAAAAWVSCRLLGVPARPALWLGAIFCAGGVGWVAVLPMVSPLWTRAVFDRELGRITLSGWRFPGRPILRIEDVTGVQLCGPVEHSDWCSYQLNLALIPGAFRGDRLNLLDNGEPKVLRRMGAELAAFLGVQLVDDSQVGLQRAGQGGGPLGRRGHPDRPAGDDV